MKPGGISSRWCVTSTTRRRAGSRAPGREIGERAARGRRCRGRRSARRAGPARGRASARGRAAPAGARRPTGSGSVCSASAPQPNRSRSERARVAIGVVVAVPPRRQRGVLRGHHRLGRRSCVGSSLAAIAGDENAMRSRSARTSRATQPLAEHVDRSRGSDAGRARRSAAASSCPRRWRRARPTARRARRCRLTPCRTRVEPMRR